MQIYNPVRSLKVVFLLPLVAAFVVIALLYFYTYAHQEAEYTGEYVDDVFASAQRLLDSAVVTNADKLSASLSVLSRDETIKHAMLVANKQTLMQRAKPIFDSLRSDFDITHLYFIRPDRSVFLRVHQPDRYGDVIDRFTAKKAETTGKLATGVELGPSGTLTLRSVIPWRDGDHLIGYLELGEEVGYILDSIHKSLGLDVFLTINKRYLSQQDWSLGMDLLKRKSAWDALPDSAIVFQSMQHTSDTIRNALAQKNVPTHTYTKLSDNNTQFRLARIPFIDAGGREVGNVLLLRDVTARSTDSMHDLLIAGSVAVGLTGVLIWLFYLIISKVEKRLASSQAEIKQSEMRFRGLVESSSDWIWEVDAKGHYVYVSPKVKDLLGYLPEEVLGKIPFDFMPQEEAVRVSREFSIIAAAHRSFHNLENRNLHKDGRIVMLETSGVPILNKEGSLLGYRGVDRDITARIQADKVIKKSTQRLNLLFQQTPLAVIEWDTDFRVASWNPAAEVIFGYTKEEALGRHAMDIILPESAKNQVNQIWESLLDARGDFRGANENLTKNGKTIYCEWYNTPLIELDGKIIGVTSLAQDVTDQKYTKDRITYLAFYDELTGLPNRMLFKDRLSQVFIEAERKERLAGIMFMDIDHFKDVNDTLGHEAGNLLLKAVAKRLQDCFRPSDTVARFGGDEFAVILADVGHVDDIVQVAQHVLDGFNSPFDLLGHEMFVTFSMGITIYPIDDGNVDNLLRNADSAMYVAKAEGRNCYRFYAASMTVRATERLALQAGLRHALNNEEFILHYQPQLDVITNRIIGVEALVRWQHPEKGMISPAEFIPIAEETGIIVPLGEWVLHTACQQAKMWQDQGLFNVCMAVNLSARQFKEPLFAQRVLEIVHESGLDPHSLELEVTESILVDGLESIKTVLQEFKQEGIRISLDDFGTGYSSLSYLKRFPIDKLKIDQSFVRDVLLDMNDAALVKAIIAMSKALGLKAIAEGVETQGQLDFLRIDGCDEIQGFHISRPISAEDVANLILRYNMI